MSKLQCRRRALIVIPGTVNYFYNLCGKRIAEALRGLRFEVDMSTLANCPEREYDYCLIANISEVLVAFGDEAGGIEKIHSLRQRSGTIASCAIDCVQTHWFQRLHDLSVRSGADFLLDLGLHDQSRFLDPRAQSIYRFVFSGLTPSERRSLDSPQAQDVDRPIPWAFIGHGTPYRAALVDHLIQTVSTDGFVYMPGLAPYTEKGSPHLNQQQWEAVLQRTRYQVWCSHHAHFYLEPERFRTSLLTGGVPIKIIASREDLPGSVPFRYLLMGAHDVGERLTPRLFSAVRSRFQREWRAFPSLAEELARVLLRVPGFALDRAGARAA